MKLSIDELNTMTMQDLCDFIEMWTDDGKDRPRRGTQADIKRFFG